MDLGITVNLIHTYCTVCMQNLGHGLLILIPSHYESGTVSPPKPLHRFCNQVIFESLNFVDPNIEFRPVGRYLWVFVYRRKAVSVLVILDKINRCPCQQLGVLSLPPTIIINYSKYSNLSFWGQFAALCCYFWYSLKCQYYHCTYINVEHIWGCFLFLLPFCPTVFRYFFTL